MTDKKYPPSKIKKSSENTEGLFITPDAVLHNNLYVPPSHKTLNDNKGSLHDTFKKFRGLIILTLIAAILIAIVSFS